MRIILFFAVLIAAVFLGAGCCAQGGKIAAEGWQLDKESLAGAGKNWQKPEREITFVIDTKGKFYGCAGVNRYFGTAKLDEEKGTLKFGNVGATMMAGPGGEYERAFLKMLNSVDSYKVCGDDLYLMSSGKAVAGFDRKSLRDINENN